jgi:hypothetical protein
MLQANRRSVVVIVLPGHNRRVPAHLVTTCPAGFERSHDLATHEYWPAPPPGDDRKNVILTA